MGKWLVATFVAFDIMSKDMGLTSNRNIIMCLHKGLEGGHTVIEKGTEIYRLLYTISIVRLEQGIGLI